MPCEDLNQMRTPLPQPFNPSIHTSNQLEGTAENIQGAHEQVEEPQEQKELPDPLQDTQNLPFGVSLWGREKAQRLSVSETLRSLAMNSEPPTPPPPARGL